MGDDHGVGATTGLVKEDEVGDALGEAGGGEGTDHGVAAVEAIGIGEDEAQLLNQIRHPLAP